MSKKALFYHKESEFIKCDLCFHSCRIKKAEKGICGVRENRGGVLISLNYAKLVATARDPIEKKPLYHFYPATYAYSIAAAGCNLKCKFCQNWTISQVQGREKELLSLPEVQPQEVVEAVLSYNCASIAYTYTEPTVFIEYVLDTAFLAKEHHILNVFISNGFMQKEVVKELANCIDAFNIDLKSFSDRFYSKICGAEEGSLAKILDNLAAIKEKDIWLEITTLFIPSLNDSPGEMRQIAKFIAQLDKNIPWHISAFYPSYKLLNLPPTSSEVLKAAYDIGKEEGLRFIYIGNIVTKSGSNTYCPSCHNLLVEREGFWVVKNLLEGKGNCPYCGLKIAGRF